MMGACVCDPFLTLGGAVPSRSLRLVSALQLSKKYHPDVPAPEGESQESRTQKFHAISEAYNTLHDDGKHTHLSALPRPQARHRARAA